LPPDDFSQVLNLAPYGFSLAIQFDDEMGAAIAESFAPGAFVSGSEGKFIGQFEYAGQKTGGQDGLQRTHGVFHGTETHGEICPERRQRNQFERGFGDDAEQAFGTDEKTVEVKASFVFVRSAPELDHRAVSKDDFEAENIIAGDAVFEAVRAAGIGGDVAANKIIRAAGGVGRIKESAFLNSRLEFLRVDARLDDGDEIAGIDFPDAVHAFERQDDAAAHGHAAADVAVARAARGDGQAMLIRKTQYCRDGLGGAGQGDGVRLMRGEPFVPGVTGERGGCQDNFIRQVFFEPAEQF
jgi:hypothetical protein